MGNTKSEIKRIDKPWGHEEVLLDRGDFGFKRLVLNPGKVSSFHYHEEKNEVFYVESGTATIKFEDSEKTYSKGESLYLAKGTKHQILNNGTEDLSILEFGYPFSLEDVVRVEDPWEGKR